MSESMYKVEKATIETLPQVAIDMYMDTTYAKQVRDMIAKDLFVLFTVKEGDKYVGRCTLWLAPSDEPELREEIPGVPLVNALEVHPEFYRRGIASMLITVLENEVKRRGGHLLALGVEPQNTPGRKLYEKLGFCYRDICGEKTYPAFWVETLSDGSAKRHSIDALLMTKEL